MEHTKIKNSLEETLKSGCVVLNEKNEVLLVSLIETEIWSFPKGHMEKGEKLEDTATREVLEETGYKVEIAKRLSDVTYTNKENAELIRVAMFLAKPIEKLNTSEEKTRSAWFEIDRAKKIIYPNLVFVLDELN